MIDHRLLAYRKTGTQVELRNKETLLNLLAHKADSCVRIIKVCKKASLRMWWNW